MKNCNCRVMTMPNDAEQTDDELGLVHYSDSAQVLECETVDGLKRRLAAKVQIAIRESDRWWQVYATALGLTYDKVAAVLPSDAGGEAITKAAVHLAGNVADEAIRQAIVRGRI